MSVPTSNLNFFVNDYLGLAQNPDYVMSYTYVIHLELIILEAFECVRDPENKVFQIFNEKVNELSITLKKWDSLEDILDLS
jgi:hypothetical protein